MSKLALSVLVVLLAGACLMATASFASAAPRIGHTGAIVCSQGDPERDAGSRRDNGPYMIDWSCMSAYPFNRPGADPTCPESCRAFWQRLIVLHAG